jgi:hypothetical protein
MWWSLSSAVDAYGATVLNDTCVIYEPATGRLLTLTPQLGRSPATVLGDGWLSPRSVAALPDGSRLVVADANETVWLADPTRASPHWARRVSNGLGLIGQIAVRPCKVGGE